MRQAKKKSCKPKKKKKKCLRESPAATLRQDVWPQRDTPACLGNDHLRAGLVELLPQLPLVKSHLDVLDVLRTMTRAAIRVGDENAWRSFIKSELLTSITI